MYIGLLHVTYRYYCEILMKLEFLQTFQKYSNIIFHENPSSGSRDVPCGQTDMTKLILAFRNFANVPKNVINRHAMEECGRVCTFVTSILVEA
jgi:hypothetical protein